MKKNWIIGIFCFIVSFALFFPSVSVLTASAEDNAESIVNCKSAYCTDENGSVCMYRKEENKRLPIASMCKIMTLILSFDALKQGKIDYETPIEVSERAMSMGGSQVYLQAGNRYTVDRLLESIVVCSANDSCVAMAEAIAGSDVEFVNKMNDRAKKLGCTDTLFANCTGLPKDPQYSCAKDVAIMLCELVKNDKFFEYTKIRTDDFPHEDGRTTLITNTNKLMQTYSECDGGKTGYTAEAGFCLAATAKKDEMRIISVCIGAADSKERFQSVKNMFEYAFANYESKEIVNAATQTESIAVQSAKKPSVSVQPKFSYRAIQKKGDGAEYTLLKTYKPLKAPVCQGDEAGKMVVYRNGKAEITIPLICTENVDKASFGDYFKQISVKMGSI